MTREERNEYHRNYYRNNREKILLSIRARSSERQEELKTWLQKFVEDNRDELKRYKNNNEV